nr:peptide chain release factor N(5)-glutamine methyltransferase [Corynebacterium liangguodongii]
MKQSSRQLVAAAARVLADAGVDTPLVDARLIAADLLGLAPLEVNFAEVPDGFEERYRERIARRARREPLQHITGVAAFGPLELAVGPGVFIPRPETEVLAEWAVRALAGVDKPRVVDLGTGSGALAIAIAHARGDASVTAVDASTVARDYAAANARRAGVSVDVVAGDFTDPGLLAPLRGRVDLVVSNPPYVPENPGLSPEVYFDPHEAVFSGASGMDAIRGLIPVAAALLAPGGALGIEHDEETSELVLREVAAHGELGEPAVLRDLTGRARFVTASKVVR